LKIEKVKLLLWSTCFSDVQVTWRLMQRWNTSSSVVEFTWECFHLLWSRDLSYWGCDSHTAIQVVNMQEEEEKWFAVIMRLSYQIMCGYFSWWWRLMLLCCRLSVCLSVRLYVSVCLYVSACVRRVTWLRCQWTHGLLTTLLLSSSVYSVMNGQLLDTHTHTRSRSAAGAGDVVVSGQWSVVSQPCVVMVKRQCPSWTLSFKLRRLLMFLCVCLCVL